MKELLGSPPKIAGVGAFSNTSLGDIVRGFGRYRPVVVTVGIIAVVASALGPNGGGEADDLASVSLTGDAPTTTVGATAPSGSTPSAGGDTNLVAPEATDGALLPTPRPDTPAALRPSTRSTASDPTGVRPEDTAPTTTAASSFPTSAPTTEASPTPLTLRAAGWATADARTPLAGTGVPEGTLPVGTRLGQPDKESYVRLAGTDSLLTLRSDSAGRRDTAGEPAVQACRILDPGWEPADAMSFDDAPVIDREHCVDGSAVSDGTWQFDLSGFVDRTDDRGFALVAAPDAPVDFQVAFRRG